MKIKVSNIDRSTTEEDVFALFEEFGDVVAVTLNDEPDEGEFTFSATVEMDFEEDALEAINELNGESVDGEILYVRPAAKANHEQRKKLELDEIEEEVSAKLKGSDSPVLRRRPERRRR